MLKEDPSEGLSERRPAQIVKEVELRTEKHARAAEGGEPFQPGNSVRYFFKDDFEYGSGMDKANRFVIRMGWIAISIQQQNSNVGRRHCSSTK